MPHARARWVDQNGRSHEWSGDVASNDRNQVMSQIYAQTGAKKVIISSVTPNDGSSYRRRVQEQHEQEQRRLAEMEERLKSNDSGSFSRTPNYSKPKYSSSSSSVTSMDLGTSMGLLILLGGLWAFFAYTPWILMLVYGAGSTWLTEKITGQTIAEYGETEEEDQSEGAHKKALAVILSAVIFGGAGFVHGSNLQREWEVDTTDQPKVEQLKKQ